MGGKFSRGWTLTKESWALVRSDPSLAAFPVISAITALTVALVFFLIGAGAVAASGVDWFGYIVLALALYAITTVSIFFGVALAACAARSLEGEDTTFGQGVSAAWAIKGLVMKWAFVQLIVGTLITVVQSLVRDQFGAIAAAILGSILNFAWSAATFFVIPLIALENKGPVDALKESTAILKQKWGEGATGAFAIGGIVFLLGWLPAIVFMAGGAALLEAVPALGVVLIAIGVIIVIVASVIQTTIMSVFRVALYRFATEDKTLGTFDQASLANAFKRK